MRKLFVVFFAWVCLVVTVHPTAWAQPIPYKPGRYSWKVDGGEIQMVAARYTNRNSFDNRAYTFYFETVKKKHLYIVPVVGSKPSDTAFTLISSAGGDWLFSDLVIERQGGALYLIKAQQDTAGGWDAPGNLTIERFVLKKGDEEEVPYQFILQGKTMTPAAPRISVDEVLKQQLKTATW